MPIVTLINRFEESGWTYQLYGLNANQASSFLQAMHPFTWTKLPKSFNCVGLPSYGALCNGRTRGGRVSRNRTALELESLTNVTLKWTTKGQYFSTANSNSSNGNSNGRHNNNNHVVVKRRRNDDNDDDDSDSGSDDGPGPNVEHEKMTRIMADFNTLPIEFTNNILNVLSIAGFQIINCATIGGDYTPKTLQQIYTLKI